MCVSVLLNTIFFFSDEILRVVLFLLATDATTDYTTYDKYDWNSNYYIQQCTEQPRGGFYGISQNAVFFVLTLKIIPIGPVLLSGGILSLPIVVLAFVLGTAYFSILVMFTVISCTVCRRNKPLELAIEESSLSYSAWSDFKYVGKTYRQLFRYWQVR